MVSKNTLLLIIRHYLNCGNLIVARLGNKSSEYKCFLLEVTVIWSEKSEKRGLKIFSSNIARLFPDNTIQLES